VNNIVQKRYLQIALVFLCFVGFWLFQTPCPKSNKVDGFVNNLWPPPNSIIPTGCYTKRHLSAISPWSRNYPISATIAGTYIADKGLMSDSPESFDVNKNVFLFIDNKRVNIESVVEGPGAIANYPNFAASYRLGASPLLLLGNHMARIEIRSLSGKSMKFEWNFSIE
jgi:hypothetical protein